MEEMEGTHSIDELTPTRLTPIDEDSFDNIPICGSIETCELVNQLLNIPTEEFERIEVRNKFLIDFKGASKKEIKELINLLLDING